ncbi:TPA: hypothetical protein ACVOZB_004686 [Vibrio diabolicus]|nr:MULTISPECIES: hypothetical protein [Gammaproteobacteria]EGQ7763271.1 hypothetical protein [Vibrio alginolyticus]EKO3505137.1 hypothetical protein [Vibrio fluvialis]HCE2133857.1 hypothetical protein [Vibrio parahaemolyticus]MCE9854366.1 hypothetical protein [Shewanella chilikensis]MCR9478931.1 hypothetical protein [Vibrio antiquarius]
MDLEVLQFLLDNERIIEESAADAGLDESISIGIGRKLIANDGDLEELSSKQMYHYQQVLQPLLENVSCDGVMGMMETDDGDWVDTCNGDGVIDDESLLISYQEDDFKCQICRYDAEKMA